MKKRLPSNKRSRSKASTVEALHYALNCVKQVQGNKCAWNKFQVFVWLLNITLYHLILFQCSICVLSSSAANSEYYNLLMRNGQHDRRDNSICTLEELERVISEHTLKNTVYIYWHTHNLDTFFSCIINMNCCITAQHLHSYLHMWVYYCLTARYVRECVCVFLLVLCVSVTWLACVPVPVHLYICMCRTPSWWFSRCRAAAWCMRRSRLPASCAARGSF